MNSFEEILAQEILREEHEEVLSSDTREDGIESFIDDEIDEELDDLVIDDDDTPDEEVLSGTMFSVYDVMY